MSDLATRGTVDEWFARILVVGSRRNAAGRRAEYARTPRHNEESQPEKFPHAHSKLEKTILIGQRQAAPATASSARTNVGTRGSPPSRISRNDRGTMRRTSARN